MTITNIDNSVPNIVYQDPHTFFVFIREPGPLSLWNTTILYNGPLLRRGQPLYSGQNSWSQFFIRYILNEIAVNGATGS